MYDAEPNLNDDREDIKSLPKRVRFYHALIDAKSLQSGAEYKSLKNVIVIMITPYDPFGYDYMIYTVDNKIRELPEAPYNDGAQTLFLYTKGTKGVISEELKQFLQYMEQTTSENAVNEKLKEIHKMVEKVKNDEEVSIEFMKIFEREQMLISQSTKKGIEQGIELERQNTERERAEKEQELKEVERLKKKLQKLQAQKL